MAPICLRYSRIAGLLALWLLLTRAQALLAQTGPKFHVLAFFTAKEDLAHISFVHEANQWFAQMGARYGFTYDSTSNWEKMTDTMLARYSVLMFLDTRPEKTEERAAFQRFMERGGGWMGFHFSAFALTPSAYPENWSWYHQRFLGSGSYKSNTWRPTSAVLRVVNKHYAITKNLPDTFRSAPNEWYRWENDLRKNSRIDILVAIDRSSYPLGTGPKPSEIWHNGFYPVVWTNRDYRMIYFNMGHNDMDYGNTDRTVSSSFASTQQDALILAALMRLGSGLSLK